MPALEMDDGTVLTQSVAIIEYLDEVQPNPPLLPKAPLARCTRPFIPPKQIVRSFWRVTCLL